MAKKVKPPFEVLLGARIAIESFLPDEVKAEKKESKILLLDETQKEVDAEKMEKEAVNTERFKILQVGTGCSEHLKGMEGREIDIEEADRHLHPNHVKTIFVDSKIVAFIIPERAVTGVYPK